MVLGELEVGRISQTSRRPCCAAERCRPCGKGTGCGVRCRSNGDTGARRARRQSERLTVMPAPIPPKVLLLHGRGAGKDSAGYPVPTPPAFERVAPEPPDWLDSEGADEWRRVVDDLAPLGLLKNSDRAVLVAHCEAWSRFVIAAKQHHAEGVVRINPDSGRLGKSAAVAVAENAATQMAKLGGLLGLSPVAERGLGSFTPPDDDGNPYTG